MGNRSSLMVWLAALVLSLSAALVITFELNGIPVVPEQYASLIQDGPVTRAIVTVFVAALIVNAWNTLGLIRELKHLRTGLTIDHIPGEQRQHGQRLRGGGLLGLHIRRLYEIYEDSPAPDARQDASLNAIRNQLYRREWFVRSSSQLLLTLGLIGTVLGLTDSLGGLSSTVQAVGTATFETGREHAQPAADAADETRAEEPEERPSTDSQTASHGSPMTDGLNQALGGMATAFLTTLFGAVLGGVFLKLLHNCTESVIEHIIDEIELLTETRVLPALRPSLDDLLRRQFERLEEWSATFDSAADHELQRLADVSKQLESVTRHFGQLGMSIADAEAQLTQSPGHLSRLATFRANSARHPLPIYAAAVTGSVVAVAGVVRIAIDLLP